MSGAVILFKTLRGMLQAYKAIEYQFLRIFRPLRDIQVLNEDAYVRIASDPRLGFFECFVEGWIDCQDLTTLLLKTFANKNLVKLFRFNEADLMEWFNLEKEYNRNLDALGTHYNYGNNPRLKLNICVFFYFF
jgi:hypothetical protein